MKTFRNFVTFRYLEWQPYDALASFVCSSRSRNVTMFPKVLTELRIRLVREYAWISPWARKPLSTYSVLSVVASKPVRNMFTTIATSSSRFRSRSEKSL